MRFPSKLALGVVAMIVVLGACGSSTKVSTAAAGGGAHNAADVTFVQGMIPHHEQAIDMANLQLAGGINPKVRPRHSYQRRPGPRSEAYEGLAHRLG